MQYAVNTQGSVIRENGRYYCVDNGVWFESNSPQGPWVVSTDRPQQEEAIPPNYPVYNTKYVYIYDVTPDWAYMGYTPGYLNTYIYGPTVVYGTGFYYSPWYGNYYYPRPYTWGFNMAYNPWYGWSLGYGYGYGWFNVGFGVSIWGGWRGGWWGPSIYHPPYRWGGAGRFGYGGGYYGNRIAFNSNLNRYNSRYTTNIYNNRTGIVTNNRTTTNNFNRAATNTGTRYNSAGTNGVRGNQPRTNNITTDRQGNVYQRNTQGQWQQRQQRQWQPVNNNQQVQNLNRQQQMQTRGQVRTQNYQQARSRTTNTASRSGGGGGRSGKR
jgi:hypothetical protein